MEWETNVVGHGRWEGRPGPGVAPGGWPRDRSTSHGRPWDELLDEVIDDGRGLPSPGRWLTRLAFVGDRLVDVTREPVSGSDYECLALDLDRPVRPPEPPRPPGHELQLVWLATVVGGPEALGTLTDDPLPEEDLAIDEVPVHCRVRVGSVDRRMCEPVLELMGAEALTAARRVLVRLARESPGAIGRTERDETAAAAVLWAVARGNDLAGQGRPLRAIVVQQAFGLRSSPSSRALSYAHAVGGGPSGFAWNGYYGVQSPDVVPLADPGFLLSSFRARLVAARDRALELRRRTEVA